VTKLRTFLETYRLGESEVPANRTDKVTGIEMPLSSPRKKGVRFNRPRKSDGVKISAPPAKPSVKIAEETVHLEIQDSGSGRWLRMGSTQADPQMWTPYAQYLKRTHGRRVRVVDSQNRLLDVM
jgi:hypothetical protein